MSLMPVVPFTVHGHFHFRGQHSVDHEIGLYTVGQSKAVDRPHV